MNVYMQGCSAEREMWERTQKNSHFYNCVKVLRQARDSLSFIHLCEVWSCT